MIKIYNNFLKKETFEPLKEILTGPYFPWFFNNRVVENKIEIKNFQFIHTFFADNIEKSPFMSLLTPILNKIKPITIVRIKANLLTHTEKKIEHGFHKDFNSTKNKKITTGIFYINTNNGYTKFKNNKKIESKENTFIEFNSNKMHTGSSCTDEKKKIVLNFNYIK
jgi:hypothetical protein